MSSDWRPANNIPEPPKEATPLAPVSIREAEVVKENEGIAAQLPQTPQQTPDDGKFKGLPVRVAGDKIWLLKEGKRSWVTSAEVYSSLGFKFGDEKQIDSETLMCIPEGLPIR